jgi:polysaccharide pyruvyl transferase WcaK-like protein
VLLVGYNGANNTGAEALLLSDLEDVRAVLGPQAFITVPTLNEPKLRRYLAEGPTLEITPINPVFFVDVWRLVRAHDLVVLVEGSAYMDTWTSALLWYFLWATYCASAMGKPCLAYAVDAGSMSAFNQRLTRLVASRTDLIVTRSQAAAERLRAFGVRAPIEVTADNAFNFQPDSSDAGWVQQAWPEARELVGLAVVNFHLFPVVMRPWGQAEDCYRWPYYYSSSPERSRAAEALADGYAALADRLVERHGKSIALIAMEELDERLARAVLARMHHPEGARVFSSREHNASKMTVLLRGLELLVTSRYHACVLSLAAQVPQVAVGHDLRLETIYRELGWHDRYFLRPGTPGLFETLEARVEDLLANPALERERLRQGFEAHLASSKRNRELLRAFAQAHGWGVRA